VSDCCLTEKWVSDCCLTEKWVSDCCLTEKWVSDCCLTEKWVSDCCLTRNEKYFSYIIVNTSYIRGDDDVNVHFVLDQHGELDFYRAGSMKQLSVGRHVFPLQHTTWSQANQSLLLLLQASTLTFCLTCPFGQLTKKSTCPTQSFCCPIFFNIN
jgi:hypothetical protein